MVWVNVQKTGGARTNLEAVSGKGSYGRVNEPLDAAGPILALARSYGGLSQLQEGMCSNSTRQRALGLYFLFDHQRGTSMKTCLIALSCCVTMAAMLAYAQMDEGYQMARVVSFEKLAASAQHPEDSDRYKISMRLGNTVYSCHASAPAAVFLDWSDGKEFPAKLNGKVLQVKGPSGQVVELNIVGKKTPK